MKQGDVSIRRFIGLLLLLSLLTGLFTACGEKPVGVPLILSGQDDETGCHWSATAETDGIVSISEPEIGDLSTVYTLLGQKAGTTLLTCMYGTTNGESPYKVKTYRVQVDEQKQVVYTQISGITRTIDTLTVLYEEAEPYRWVCESVEGTALNATAQEMTVPAETNASHDTEVSYGTAECPNVHSFAFTAENPGETVLHLACKDGATVKQSVVLRVTVGENGIERVSEE